MDVKTLKENLRTVVQILKDERGMTAAELAKKAKLSKVCIDQILQGRHEPSIHTYLQLSKVFKLSPGRIATLAEKMGSNGGVSQQGEQSEIHQAGVDNKEPEGPSV